MKVIKICKRCQTYLLDHTDPELLFKGWKKCPSCNWSCDREGYNLVEPKPAPPKKENDDFDPDDWSF